MSWTGERVTMLKKLWAEAQSASAIAATLGEVTRNAVIGKAHRLGLAGRATTSRRPGTLRAASPSFRRQNARKSPRPFFFPAAPKRPTPAKPTPVVLGPAPEIPVTVATLTERTCRWPEGDPKQAGFHFCGRAKPEGHPYCDHHAAVAFR